MRIWVYLAAATMILASASAGFDQPTLAADSLKGWTLKQKQLLTGDQTIYITANAIRLENKELGFIAILRSSDKNMAYFINAGSKRFAIADMNKPQQFFASRLSEVHGVDPGSTKDVKWKNAGEEVFRGVKANRWTGAKIVLPDRRGDKPRHRVFTAWLPAGMKIDPLLCENLAKINGWPNVAGAVAVPVHGTMKDDNNREKLGMDLVSFKEASLSPDLFVPKIDKFKKMPSTDSVVISGQKEGLVEDMAKTFGDMYDEPAPKNAPKK